MNLPVGDHDQGTTEEPPSEYVVVLRAPSAARFKEDEGVALSLDDKAFNTPIQVKLRTRWIDEGFESRVPRELWIELGITAVSLDEACSAASSVAHLLTVIATFCANVTGQVPEVHLAYRREPKDGQREFIEVFLPDETTSPREGRSIETTEYVRLVEALWSSPEQRRIIRALNQYEVALRYWYLGGEWLSLTHLYMAVEALTKTAIRHECGRLGITEEELARHNGIDPDDPERPRWRPALEAWARSQLLFDGDDIVFSAAKDASDGIEHGYMEFSEINQKAIAATLSTFGYVRVAVLRFLGLPEDSDLALREPLDVGSLRKMVRGYFVGDVEDPAPAGNEYPHLVWNSKTKVFRRSGERFLYTPEEKMTVQCADGVAFRGTSFEVRGRLQSGGFEMLDESPLESGAETQQQAGAQLFDSARQLVERVRAAVSLPAVFIPRQLRIVFQTLAEHVAIFEAVAALVDARRPVEALLLVNIGIQSTCRLQLMADEASGAAWITRAQLDSDAGA
ncbi:hypothetical protein [Mycolicibacterium fortuitum]|uniref:hypothetical protein n=1 Tax=Mycolicibacterium fortuitum TaxID=1766 RepID=UPI002626AE8F|nr:hypothetical protein [Mycolicibacterium fortuitum]